MSDDLTPVEVIEQITPGSKLRVVREWVYYRAEMEGGTERESTKTVTKVKQATALDANFVLVQLRGHYSMTSVGKVLRWFKLTAGRDDSLRLDSGSPRPVKYLVLDVDIP